MTNDWTYLIYLLLGALLFLGSSPVGKGQWNEEYTSLKQTKMLQGFTALLIAFHHMSQKTCAPWKPQRYMVHGLDPFIPMGYMLVGFFLFCNGLGLYKSLKSKPNYLHGFVRRRIVPLIIAYYLSEIIYLALRLIMGQQMTTTEILWYLSGLHMANANGWYLIVIPFFCLVFWAAFRFCKREGTAILLVFLFTLAYTVLGASIDHQNDWWMRGEWWYNSILLFPLGLLFAKFEAKVTAFFRKGYWLWLVVSIAAVFLLFRASQFLNNGVWGYYGSGPMKVPHRLMSAAFEWLVSLAYVWTCFLIMMKVRFGNPILKGLSLITLEFYLMHGMFVELFGFNFLELTPSLVYIRNVPLYVAAVLACSVPAALIFRFLWKRLSGRTVPRETT